MVQWSSPVQSPGFVKAPLKIFLLMVALFGIQDYIVTAYLFATYLVLMMVLPMKNKHNHTL